MYIYIYMHTHTHKHIYICILTKVVKPMQSSAQGADCYPHFYKTIIYCCFGHTDRWIQISSRCI